MTDGVTAGSTGVLRPGRLLWLRALAWGAFLIAVASIGGRFFLPGLPGLKGAWSEINPLLDGLFYVALYAVPVWLGERRPVTELAPWPGLAEFAAALLLTAASLAGMGVVLRAVGLDVLAGRAGEVFRFGYLLPVAMGVTLAIMLQGVAQRLLARAFGAAWGLGLLAAATVLTIVFSHLNLLSDLLDGRLQAGLAVWSAAAVLEVVVLPVLLYRLTGRLWATAGLLAAALAGEWGRLEPVRAVIGGAAGLDGQGPLLGLPLGVESALPALGLYAGAAAVLALILRRRVARGASGVP